MQESIDTFIKDFGKLSAFIFSIVEGSNRLVVAQYSQHFVFQHDDNGEIIGIKLIWPSRTTLANCDFILLFGEIKSITPFFDDDNSYEIFTSNHRILFTGISAMS